MFNITLISTEHRQDGKCNSDELLNIIETINPDLIFEEEVNDEKFQRYYNEDSSSLSLEIQTIKAYLKKYEIPHIPVDVEVNFNFQEWDYMFETFKSYQVYKELLHEHCSLRNQDGFKYLNSEKCMEIFDKMQAAEKQIIEFSGFKKERLSRIYSTFHEKHDARENAMLQKICEYCDDNEFKQAVYLVGYAHRKSMIQKINELQQKVETKLKWTFYNEKT